MLKPVALAAVLAASVTGPALAQDSETLRVGMSGGYFPFTFVRQDELQGFEVDVMDAVGEEAGLEIEYETMSFSGLIGALEAGRIDTIAALLDNLTFSLPKKNASHWQLSALEALFCKLCHDQFPYI